MSDTLDALHRTVIANPPDRTVRLVYADALDETGEPVHVARAEFIRTQIDLDSLSESDPRHAPAATRCSELFEANWLAWWRPVAEAAGLPEPHVPGKRVRDRIKRAVRRPRRPANWPYTHTTADTAVYLVEYGLSFRFACGFPEEVRFVNLDVPEDGPTLVHRWGDSIPLTRLTFSPPISATEWNRLNGPHLARLADLSLDRVLPDAAPVIAESPELASLTRLAMNPLGSNPDTIRAFVASPPWMKLQTLKVTGRLAPEGVRELANACNLEHLEELELAIGNPGLLGSPLVEVASEIFRMMMRAVAFPATAEPRWVEFGPALESLAAAPWVKRLRQMRIVSGHQNRLLSMFGERLHGGPEAAADVIPDAAVIALAAALNRDKLERLVLPAAIVGPSVREELTTRLGGRIAFT